jgi:membrane protein YqaA with SNARE-associated domain
MQLPSWLTHLGRYAARPWYPFALAALAAADMFVLFIPAEGIMVASAIAYRTRWLLFALATTVGSTLGSLGLAYVLTTYGHGLIEWLSPGIHDWTIWKATDGWIDNYGIWAMLGLAISPLVLVPAVALGALAELPVAQMGIVIFLGRGFRNSVYTWLASHAPRVLFRLKSVRKEVEVVAGEKPVAGTDKPEAPASLS